MDEASSLPWFSLLGFEAPVHSCVFVQGTRRDCLVTGCEDGMLLLWDLKERKCAWQMRCHRGAILGLQAFPNAEGQLLVASWGRDQLLQVWNVTAFVGHATPASSPAATKADGSGDDDADDDEQFGGIVIPFLEVKKELGGINFCRMASVSLRVHDDADGHHRGGARAVLALSDADNETLLLVDTWTWETMKIAVPDQGQLMAVALFAADNDTTGTSHSDECASSSNSDSHTGSGSCESKCSGFVALTAHESGQLRLWRMQHNQHGGNGDDEGDKRPPSVGDREAWFAGLQHELLSTVEVTPTPVPVVSVAYQQGRILCGNAESKLFVVAVPSDWTMTVKKELSLPEGLTNAISVRDAPARLFAAACSDNKVRVYSRKGRALAVLDQHVDSALCVAHSAPLKHVTLSLIDPSHPPGGVLLASGGKDCVVHLWSLYNEDAV